MISLKWEFKSWDVWQLLTSMIVYSICSSTSSSSNRPVKATEVHSLEFSPMTLCRRAEGRTYAVTKNSQRSPVYALRRNNIKQYEQSHGSTGSAIKRSLSCWTNALDAVRSIIEIFEHHWIILNHWTSVIPKDCTSSITVNKNCKQAAKDGSIGPEGEVSANVWIHGCCKACTPSIAQKSSSELGMLTIRSLSWS